MANLTAKELSAIEDLLAMEENLVKKFTAYSQTATDPQLRRLCECAAAKHQSHMDRLLRHLD